MLINNIFNETPFPFITKFSDKNKKIEWMRDLRYMWNNEVEGESK